MKHLIFSTVVVILVGCNSQPSPTTTSHKEEGKSSIPMEESPIKRKNIPPKLYKDRCEFVHYNDNFDYFYIDVLSGTEHVRYVNNLESRELLRGDLIEVTWKYDTIYIAGDGERPEIDKWMVSVKKLKDGKASVFRKTQNKLNYHWSTEEEFSESFLHDLYLLVEYYVANSPNELIKNRIQNKQPLSYSIETREQNNRTYTVMGIGATIDHQFSIMQWIYFDWETESIYEYDLATEKLIRFD